MKKFLIVAIPFVALATLATYQACANGATGMNAHNTNVTREDPLHVWIEGGKVHYVQFFPGLSECTWEGHRRGDGWQAAGPYRYFLGGTGTGSEWRNRSVMSQGERTGDAVKFVFTPCGTRTHNIIVDGSDGTGWTDQSQKCPAFYEDTKGTDKGFRLNTTATGVTVMGGHN